MPISSRNTASTFAARVGVSCWRLYSCHWTSACGATLHHDTGQITRPLHQEVARQHEVADKRTGSSGSDERRGTYLCAAAFSVGMLGASFTHCYEQRCFRPALCLMN